MHGASGCTNTVPMSVSVRETEGRKLVRFVRSVHVVRAIPTIAPTTKRCVLLCSTNRVINANHLQSLSTICRGHKAPEGGRSRQL